MDSGEAEYVATVLPLRHWWDVIPFMFLANKIQRQIREAPGNIAHNTSGNLWKKTFWTMSSWTDRESIRAFVATEPHATAVRRMEEWAAEGAGFAEWTQRSGPLAWSEAKRRLANPTFYYDRSHSRPSDSI